VASGTKEDSLFEAATNVLGDALLDALDSVKAVASVAVEKAEEAFDDIVEKAEEVIDSFQKEETPAAKPAESTELAAEKDGIIIDDVVHKSAEEEPAATESDASTEESATEAPKAKRAPKKKTEDA